VNGSDPEVTSFERKSPGSGCRRLTTRVYCTFHFLQGYSSQEEAVTWQEMTSRDLRRPEATRKWHFTGSYLEVAVEGRKLAYTVHFIFLQDCSSQAEAVTWKKMMSRDLRWLEVTRKWPRICCRRPKAGVYCTFHFLQGVARWTRQPRDRKRRHVTSGDRKWPMKRRYLTGSYLEVAVQCRKLAYTVHITSYKTVARRRRLSRDRKWRHVTSGDWKWQRSDVIWPEVI